MSSHTLTLTHASSHTLTLTNTFSTRTHSCILTRTHSHTHSHTRILTHTHILTLTYTHSLSHTHTLTHTSSHTHTHTLTHTLSHASSHSHIHTLTHVGFYGLWGLSIGVMVFILYKLYVLLPYTYPTPKLSPHRRWCISIFPPKNSLCMIYKRFKLWGH